jgi:ATP-dependent helicase/nuclease subunit B
VASRTPRILRDLDRMLVEDDRWRREHDARVVASELVFGLEGRPPVRLELEHGTVLLKGKADKIDVTREGVIVVTDIKTGSSSSYKGLTKDPVLKGTKLQLPAYAQAALDAFGGSEARAEYWFVRKDKEHVGIDLNDGNHLRYREAIATLIESISRGIFAAKPPVNDYAYGCSFCSPDGVSPGDLRTRWMHKRNDIRMQRLVSLIDPTAVQGDSA